VTFQFIFFRGDTDVADSGDESAFKAGAEEEDGGGTDAVEAEAGAEEEAGADSFKTFGFCNN
jgi:hypothetical protein